MNAKKILAIFMCMLVTALIPAAAGTMEKTNPQTSDIGYTHVMGIITKPKLVDGGKDIQFRCIFVHYTTRGIGETMSGNLHLLQKLVFKNHFTGTIYNHFIFARFPGELHF
jgi:hypothetical protein